MNWLREQNGLSWSQMLQRRWELTHLELIAGMWTREGGPRTLNGAPQVENGQQGLGTTDPCLSKREKPGELSSLHQGAGMQEEGGGDDIDAEEKVVRDDFTVRVGDSTTLNLIAAVTKAHNAAMKANEDANSAYIAVAQRTAELVTHLVQRTAPVVTPGRYLEAAQPVNYPWRSRTKRHK
ncbi:hypothetical protein FJTKL_06748 [Diaporthe vaccinii]|uniref:Uncharacterized protein n=1 Tax=Diaporthe vaccinii TaxID=105482 RepID=A0ABR4DQT2_9PEZI